VLAQPELALRHASEDGTGPYRIVARKAASVVLEPRTPHALPMATLRGLPAALAVVRFKHQQADLVAGGTIGSLALVRAADLAGPTLRFDPVHGLYGLTVIGDGGALADPQLRRALMMGLDDETLISQAELPGLSPANGLVAADVGDFTPPAMPDWLNQPVAQRRPLAAATIQAWTAKHGHAPEATIVRPEDAGDRLMVNLLAAQWRALGVTVTLVARGQLANLALIDEIAPIAAPEWYLSHFTCKATIACSPVADASLAAAGQDKLRAALTGETARLMTDEVPFFPLANPLRWSLVAPSLDGYRDNPLALHPLATLRARPAN
jgi:oligopeptide transport system substrate-binding protein